jgi:uncharacterized protein
MLMFGFPGEMDPGGIGSGPIDLDALDDYLMSDHAPDDSMWLSDLDGFLTGIAVSPEVIPPSEWLPVIWGGATPAFRTEAERRLVLGTIIGRYDEIVRDISLAPETFLPILWEAADGQLVADDWTSGFLGALALRPKGWEPLLTHRLAGMLIAPLLMLHSVAERDAGAAMGEDECLGSAPDVIPACVAGIQEFWRHYRKRSANRSRRHARPRSRASSV